MLYERFGSPDRIACRYRHNHFMVLLIEIFSMRVSVASRCRQSMTRFSMLLTISIRNLFLVALNSSSWKARF